MFEVKTILLHGREKYEIVYAQGGKHVAYLNDKNEANVIVRLLNRK